MQCVLVRHGEAVAQAESDAERALSDEGHRQVDMAAQWLSDHWRPDAVICSPYRRARQTARAFGQAFGLPAVVESLALTPDARVSEFEQLLEEHSHHQKLLLIGHNPLLTDALSWFCGDAVHEPMATASMALLDIEIVARGGGILEWLRHYPDYEQVACRQ